MNAAIRLRKVDAVNVLKPVSAIFIKCLFFHQMIALQKLWKMLFISSKKLFLFSRYSNFCISVLPSFLHVGHCFRGWSKINRKVHDVINCLNKNSLTHFVWYLEKEIETLSIEGVSDKKHFYRKIMQKNMYQELVPDLFIILVNNPKQPLHERNYFKSKMFWKRIIRKS